MAMADEPEDDVTQLAAVMQVVKESVDHLENARGDTSYIETHVLIRLRGILDHDLANSAFGSIERMAHRVLAERNEVARALADMLNEAQVHATDPRWALVRKWVR